MRPVLVGRSGRPADAALSPPAGSLNFRSAVGVCPGLIELARIPYGPSSDASWRVR